MKQADGYFWGDRHGNPYCVIVLDRTRHEWRRKNGERVQRLYVREYQAQTVTQLRALAARSGWRLPRNVRRLCRTSARWVYGR